MAPRRRAGPLLSLLRLRGRDRPFFRAGHGRGGGDPPQEALGKALLEIFSGERARPWPLCPPGRGGAPPPRAPPRAAGCARFLRELPPTPAPFRTGSPGAGVPRVGNFPEITSDPPRPAPRALDRHHRVAKPAARTAASRPRHRDNPSSGPATAGGAANRATGHSARPCWRPSPAKGPAPGPLVPREGSVLRPRAPPPFARFF